MSEETLALLVALQETDRHCAPPAECWAEIEEELNAWMHSGGLSLEGYRRTQAGDWLKVDG